MIQRETKIVCVDNSGADLVKFLGNKTKKNLKGFLGNIILVSIQKKKKKKRKLYNTSRKKYRSLLLTVKKKNKRLDGTFFSSKKTSCILLQDNFSFVGQRFNKNTVVSKDLFFRKIDKKVDSKNVWLSVRKSI